MSKNQVLEVRVARLEREGRAWRYAATVSMLIAAIAWVVPAASAQPQTIKAENISADSISAHQIYVTPGTGTSGSQISLGANDDGAGVSISGRTASLEISGPNSSASVSLAVTGSKAGLAVLGSDAANVLVSGSTASVKATNFSSGHSAAAIADAQASIVSAFGPSQSAYMGYQPNEPGAFRAYDSDISPTDPVWTAP